MWQAPAMSVYPPAVANAALTSPQPSRSGGGGGKIGSATGPSRGTESAISAAPSFSADPPGDSEQQQDGAAQQAQAEEMQMDVALMALGLPREHRLCTAEPLPPQLLQTARLCLMQANELYRLSARLHLDGVEEAGKEAAVKAEVNEGLLLASQGGDPVGGAASAVQRGVKRRADGPPGASSSPAVHESAMHVVPRRRATAAEGPSSSQPATLDSLLFGCSGAARASLELPVLSSLQLQLESKLQDMVSEQMARRLLAVPEHAPPLFAHPAASSSSLSPHAALALGYLRGQRDIVSSALKEVRLRVGEAVLTLHQHVQPRHQSRPGVFGSQGSLAFDVVPSIADGPVSTPSSASVAASGPDAFCSVPAVFSATAAQHAELYAAWLEDQAGAAAEAAMDDEDGPGTKTCLGLREVTCRPRREALQAAAAAAGGSATRSSGSGKAGKRRPPLAAVSLRVLRGGGGPAGGSAPPAPAPAPAAGGGGGDKPTLPAGISAALGLDMDLAYDPVAWGAVVSCADVDAGDVLLRLPEECAIMAGSRRELLASLMVTAHALLQVS